MLVSLISGTVTTIGAVLTVLFVSRKEARAAEIKAQTEKKKADSDAVAREAEIEKLKDDVTSSVLARAREENARLLGRIDHLEQQAIAKDIQLASLRTTQAEQGRLVSNQRDQIASLIEQLTARDKTIANMKIELQRQAHLISELQTENTAQRAQIELMKQKNFTE